jgi:hypothetical protein
MGVLPPEVTLSPREAGVSGLMVQLDPPTLQVDGNWRWCGQYSIGADVVSRGPPHIVVMWYSRDHPVGKHPVQCAIIFEQANLGAFAEIVFTCLLLGVSPPKEAYNHLTIGGNDG